VLEYSGQAQTLCRLFDFVCVCLDYFSACICEPRESQDGDSGSETVSSLRNTAFAVTRQHKMSIHKAIACVP